MQPRPDGWRSREVDALLDAILTLETRAEAAAFLRDLCTLGELHDLAQRWGVVRMLDEGLHYSEISRRTGASTATITRIASWLHHGEGGYRAVLGRTRGDTAAADAADAAAVDAIPAVRSETYPLPAGHETPAPTDR
jgi:TrpR-related protein YerC/YecD